MKKGGSKAKGSGWEREVSKILTKWLTGSIRPYAFYRQPASGGIATIFEECGDMSGDIRAMLPVAIPIMAKLSIECKFGYPNVNFHQHLKDTKGFKVKEFWDQCIGDAQKANKYPILIFKKHGHNAIIGVDEKLNTLLPYGIKLNKSITISFENLTSITFYDMIRFLDIVTPDIIEGLPPWQN